MATFSYKCPNCGAPLEFNPDLQKIKCEYCLSEMEPKEVLDFNQEEKPGKARGYHCNSCGAEVVSDDSTASSTFCYYCHNPVILTDRVSGEFAPDYLIPFKISKEKARERFLAWAKSHRYLPAAFTSESQLEKITGLYLPYWQTKVRADLDIEARGVKRESWTTGREQITETSTYRIDRQGRVEIDNISELDTQKIEKPLIQAVEPYDMGEKEDFSMIYLSGFFAQTYDQGKEHIYPVLEAKANEYVDQMVAEAVGSYNDICYDKKKIDISMDEMSYCLLPAWILTFRYRDKTFVYAMNGQTGEFFGELPVDQRKLSATGVMIFIIMVLIFILGGRFLW